MGSSTTVIGGEYLVLGKIGEGSFGEVFRATHIASGVDYAIKREPIDVPHPQLEHEAKVYGILAGGDGIPKLRWFGKEGVYNAMVIDLLGPNLKQVRRENEKFPLSFVIEVGVQVISHLRFIHSRGLVYRDVKPENFLLDVDITLPDAPLGKDIHAHTPPTSLDQTMSFFNDTRKRQQSLDSNMSTSPGSPILAAYGKPHLSIVDFGLASHYRDASGKHIPNRGSTKHKVGTARYASINIHCGREHTRRDDIESVGYMLLELMIGTLPWSGISARNSRQGWAKMREIKEDIDLDELCEGLPRGFMTYIGYTRSLRFDEEPDYEYLQNLLRSCAGRGAEAQTVRCHRDPPRSLENTFGGVPIHRGGAYGKGDDPFKSRDRCKPENPLKDWRRNRPQYSPPKSDHREYSPTSLWTTTPPDAAAKKELFPKEKIEWENTDPYPDMGTDKSCSLWGEENQDAGSKNRKCSWGEDDPNARWGDESPKTTLKNRKLSWGEDDPNSRWGDEEDDDDGVSFPPFQIESFQDEVTPTIHDNKHSNGQSKAPVSSTQGLGRQFAPQDARFYLSDPPAGLKPRLGNGSGFHQTNGTPTPPSKGRQQQQQQQQQQHGQGHVYHMHAPPVHPLARDLSSLAAAQPPLPPLSPKSLSASLSSLHIRAGTHEEPGIERSQVAANRGSLSEIGSLPAKPTSSGRKTSNPQDRVRGRTDAMGTGTTTTSTNTNASAAAWDRDSGRNYGNNGTHQHQQHHHHPPSNSYGKGRSGSENWQQEGRHGYSRPGRRHHQNYHHQQQQQQQQHHEAPAAAQDHHATMTGWSEPHARQNSAPGATRAPQPGHQQPHFKSNNSLQSYAVATLQAQAHGPPPPVPPTSQPPPPLTFGLSEHRRQSRSRSRKCSNASLSSLTDQHWGPNSNKIGNGNGSMRIKPK